MSVARLVSASLLAVVAALSLPSPAAAATAIDLGTATSFAVLAGSGITNTGTTTITGDVGTFPTPSMTGFDTVILEGANHGGGPVTQEAKNSLTNAYNQAAASAPATSVATELGGRTLTPGTYHGETLGITGTLTLDTQGDPQAVFVFQTNSTLITASASSVIVLGGSTACNVFWQVASSATFGTDSVFVGTVLADTSITADDGATFEGRLLARNGAVTLQRNTISARRCAASIGTSAPTPAAQAAVTTGGTSTDATPSAIPTPAVGPRPVPTATATAAPTRPAAPAVRTPRTPPGRTTTATAGPPSGGTTTGAARPPLAATGPEGTLALLGAVMVALGLSFVRASRPLVALRHAVPRPGRIARRP